MDPLLPIPSAPITRYRFGEFTLDVRRLQLLRAGTPVEIAHRPLEVLLVLLEQAGELVTKIELLDAVWAQRMVSEAALSRCIKMLRDALGDQSQTLILTIHGYGFRFTGTVEADTAELPPVTSTVPTIDAGSVLPMRPHWRLQRALDAGHSVWLAVHDKTQEQRVFKFASSDIALAALKRELMTLRLLGKTRGPRQHFVHLLDYKLDSPPYFLEMEYCPLGSLADWLMTPEGQAAGPLLRVELVGAAAEALATAHAVGVLHRDIKPSNLLLRRTADGGLQVCWSDFGAGTADPEKLQLHGITQYQDADRSDPGGTLLYMAPERLHGEPATLSSELFALGVMLYQVRVGDLRRPLVPGWDRNFPDPLLAEDIRACADLDPAHRLADAGELARRLRQLPERQREREAAQRQTQEDAQLRQQMTLMRARRPWILLAAGLAVLAILTTSLLYLRATQAEQRQRQAADEAAEMVAFFNQDVFGAADPGSGHGDRNISLAATLSQASQRVPERFRDSPRTEAQVHRALGEAFQNLGLDAQARREFERGIALGSAADAATLHRLRILLGDLEVSAEHLDAAGSAYSDAYTTATVLHGADHADSLEALYSQGWTRYRQGHAAEAERIIRDALERADRLRPANEWLLEDIRWSLSEVEAELGHWPRARELIEQAIAHSTQDHNAGSSRLLWQKISLAYIQLSDGDEAAAEALLQDIRQIGSERLGESHVVTSTAIYLLGRLHYNRGEWTEAKALFDQAYRLRRAVHGAAHSWTRAAAMRVADCEVQLGHATAAANQLRVLLDDSERQLGAAHPASVELSKSLMLALLASGQVEAAGQQLDALRKRASELPSSSPLVAELMQAEAGLRQRQGRLDEAREAGRKACAVYRQNQPRSRQTELACG